MAYILIIDDNPQNQKYLGRIIRLRTKHLFHVASSGPEGIEQIVSERPDLIFLDLFLPDIDGFELFSLLRDHPATHSIPIIIHSANPLDDITQIRMRRIQCEAFIEFPIEASVLVHTVEEVLKKNLLRTKKWVPPKA